MGTRLRWVKPELLKARVQRWLPGVETTEVQVHMATYSLLLQIIDGRFPTGSANFDQLSCGTMVLELSGSRRFVGVEPMSSSGSRRFGWVEPPRTHLLVPCVVLWLKLTPIIP